MGNAPPNWRRAAGRGVDDEYVNETCRADPARALWHLAARNHARDPRPGPDDRRRFAAADLAVDPRDRPEPVFPRRDIWRGPLRHPLHLPAVPVPGSDRA